MTVPRHSASHHEQEPPEPQGSGTDMPDDGAAEEASVVEAEVVEAEIVGDEASEEVVLRDLDIPEDPNAAVSFLVGHLVAAQEAADSRLDDLRRVAADFENYRKRTAREFQSLTERAAERLVLALLPVLDSFEAGLAIDAQTETEEKLLGGMRSTRDQLADVLQREGLEPIVSVGEPFDPEVHEAVMTSGEGSNLEVTEELRRGYRLKGRMLRPALVALEAKVE